jgi:hypothetical protein
MRIEWNPGAEDDCKDIIIPVQEVTRLFEQELEHYQSREVNKSRGRHSVEVQLSDGRRLQVEFVYRESNVLRIQAVEVNVQKFGESGD